MHYAENRAFFSNFSTDGSMIGAFYSLFLWNLKKGFVIIRPFSPAFLLAEYRAKAFCRLSLWNFKEKSINLFHDTAKKNTGKKARPGVKARRPRHIGIKNQRRQRTGVRPAAFGTTPGDGKGLPGERPFHGSALFRLFPAAPKREADIDDGRQAFAAGGGELHFAVEQRSFRVQHFQI